MGWRTVVDVRDHSKTKGSTFTVAIMLAERAPDESRVARPGLKQLAADARVSRATAQRALARLEEMGEIEAVRFRDGGRGKATEWRIIVGTKGSQSDTPDERVASASERVSTASEKGRIDDLKGRTGDTPTEENRTTEPKRTEVSDAFGADVERLGKLLADAFAARAERAPKPPTKTSLDGIDKLIRIDGRTVKQIEFVLGWLDKPGNFWGSQIESGAKLREKFDRLVADIKRDGQGRRRSVGPSGDDLRQEAARLRSEGR